MGGISTRTCRAPTAIGFRRFTSCSKTSKCFRTTSSWALRTRRSTAYCLRRTEFSPPSGRLLSPHRYFRLNSKSLPDISCNSRQLKNLGCKADLPPTAYVHRLDEKSLPDRNGFVLLFGCGFGTNFGCFRRLASDATKCSS